MDRVDQVVRPSTLLRMPELILMSIPDYIHPDLSNISNSLPQEPGLAFLPRAA
jgi:hypothetical protein